MNVPFGRSVFTACWLGLSLGCGGREETLFIQHYRSECQGLFRQLCLVTRTEDSDEFLFMYGGIENFVYQWGFTYRLRVAVEDVDEVAADGPSIVRRLIVVESKEAVPTGTRFEMVLTADEGRIIETSTGIFEFYGERSFSCPITGSCDDLRNRIDEGAQLLLEFEHPQDPDDPLILHRWETT